MIPALPQRTFQHHLRIIFALAQNSTQTVVTDRTARHCGVARWSSFCQQRSLRQAL
jgi:hypothetical protein